jgi:hypothetical protein
VPVGQVQQQREVDHVLALREVEDHVARAGAHAAVQDEDAGRHGVRVERDVGAEGEHVGAGAAHQHVRAVAAREPVVAVGAQEDVAAAEVGGGALAVAGDARRVPVPVDRVVPAAAPEGLRFRGAVEPFASVRSNDHGHLLLGCVAV